jgi:hypothetical protein
VRPKDRQLAKQLEALLVTFDKENWPLPGIRGIAKRNVLIEQILESIHRVNFVATLRRRELSELRADPNSELFDPLRAAILHHRQGNTEEAFWLIFLFVHFGKHASAGWRYVREVYGRLGEGERWDWLTTSVDVAGFRSWLDSNQGRLKREGVPRGFGNHRKYESLDGYSPNGTGSAVETYVTWVAPPRTHAEMLEEALLRAGGDAGEAFDDLYHSMSVVSRFGRTARFDYLTMLGKVGLASIAPTSTYMQGATGPVKGARLLFGNDEGPVELDRQLKVLDTELKVGMQVIEDALCNWQKSPNKFKPFRG